MGRTIAKHFFHPYEAGENKRKEKINLKYWLDDNLPFYYEQIPIYLNKIYRTIDIKLETECSSKIPIKQCLPQIIVLDDFIKELKDHIKNSKMYESVNYNIKYNEELPELMELIKSHKYFMYYLHIPKEESGIWFCEGRFFTLEEIEKTKDEKVFKKIENFVKNKKIDYMDFLEEWVGLIFYLTAEFLLFKKMVKIIFYSCDKCYRPGIFIKEEIIEEEDDANKIWGTVNIVDTIIYNCTEKLNFSFINKQKERSLNNIIYYDESYKYRKTEVLKDAEIFKNETDGAFILITKESILDNLIKEFQKKGNKYKFDLIITGSTTEKILKKIYDLKADNYIDRVCIFTFSLNKYAPLRSKFNKIQGIYNRAYDITNFIHLKNQESEIYPNIKLLTYNDYISKYMVLHKLIANHYGQNTENCFKIAISFLKDFLLWYPKLQLNRSKEYQLKIESLLETLQKFKGINDNEEDIISIYTQENDSYYQDFNKWLNTSDPLAIQKTSWFIAAVMYSLNKYGKKKNKGINESLKLYRGIRANLSDLLNYQRAKGKIICFPSFTSTSRLIDVAKSFSKTNINSTQYETIITINYIYKEGFIPTAFDVSEISCFKNAEDEKECLFPPYSFFIIKNIQINYPMRKAEIELDTVGRIEILENKLRDGFKLNYNPKGYMEVIEQNIY